MVATGKPGASVNVISVDDVPSLIVIPTMSPHSSSLMMALIMAPLLRHVNSTLRMERHTSTSIMH